jgi:two-component system response regulator AtoC
MPGRGLLIIDDEEGVRRSLAFLLGDEGFEVDTAVDADEALERCEARSYDVILCDVRMPRRDGLDLLPDLRAATPDATIVMMSAFDDVGQALEAVRSGADDYVAKPFQLDELMLVVRKVEERERLRRENRRLRRELGAGRGKSGLVVGSDGMREVWDLVECTAGYSSTVLITGESGTGKEVVARSIHAQSARSDQPFLAVNCGAIPESLIESELFGHARGAFTGAAAPRSGLFREADGGTLFLDEVGELPAAMQVKLLRVLQEHEVRPVGEPRAVPVDVRIVAATARDLELLADELLRDLSRRLGKRVSPLEGEVLELLGAHDWPGNVRELENSLERALILARDGQLTPDLFPFAREQKREEALASDPIEASSEELSIKRLTRALEERLIRRALAHTGGNRTQAARVLEISPRALQYKLKEYGVT